LRYNGVIDVEEQMQAFQRDIDSQTSVFEFASEIHRSEIASLGLLHQDYAGQDSGYRSRGDYIMM
jgi:hypothetical protein